MKTKGSTLLVAVLLAAMFPLGGMVRAQDPQQGTSSQSGPASTQSAKANQEVQVFSGKIIKSDGKWVLQDEAASVPPPKPYVLDDQEAAKKYKGKSVAVRGTLDSSKNTIHVTKITVG
jgi:hypothetical protein